MGTFKPIKMRHPETGDEVEAASAREYNNLRYASGYLEVDAKASAPKPGPKPAAPKADDTDR